MPYPERIYAPVRKAALATVGAVCLLVLAANGSASGAAVPWGAGCESLPPHGVRTSGTCGAALVDGRAVLSPGTPPAVKEVVAAANHIRTRPYVWGGGHLSFRSYGYDCSGAVGYALHGANLLATTVVSGQLAYWGEAGEGHWITIYANAEHVFMEVAGLRFDTREPPLGERGPRWHLGTAREEIIRRFAVRHPPGL